MKQIDYLKALAIISVIILHTLPKYILNMILSPYLILIILNCLICIFAGYMFYVFTNKIEKILQKNKEKEERI